MSLELEIAEGCEGPDIRPYWFGIRDCSVIEKQELGDPQEENRDWGCAMHRGGHMKVHYGCVSSFTAPVVK